MDATGVDDLLILFAKKNTTRNLSEDERMKRRNDRLVTLPGTEVQISKKQLVEMMVCVMLLCVSCYVCVMLCVTCWM